MKVLVTTPFKLNLGFVDGMPSMIEYEAGAQDMPPDHFKHWWAQTHGVKSLEKVDATPLPINAQLANPQKGPQLIQAKSNPPKQ